MQRRSDLTLLPSGDKGDRAMVYVKWGFWGLFWLLVASFLHYTLPQHDIVRITDTYETRVDFGENSIFWANQGTGNAEGIVTRDMFFIQAVRANDRVMVYRNEDTGWGWPPFFKFNSANIQVRASDLRSTSEAPKWVVVRHYGWRNEFLSIYPNALSVRQADGPDERIINWINIIILVTLAALFWAIYVRWKRFWEKRAKPEADDWA